MLLLRGYEFVQIFEISLNLNDSRPLLFRLLSIRDLKEIGLKDGSKMVRSSSSNLRHVLLEIPSGGGETSSPGQPSYVSGRSVTCRLLSRRLRGAPFCSRLARASLFVTNVLRNRGGHERVASNVSKPDVSRNSAWDRYGNGNNPPTLYIFFPSSFFFFL